MSQVIEAIIAVTIVAELSISKAVTVSVEGRMWHQSTRRGEVVITAGLQCARLKSH